MFPQFPSIRAKVLVAVLAMVVLPPLLVFLSSWHESGVGRRMLVNVREGLRETTTLCADRSDAATLARKLDTLALRRDVWIRLLRADGSVAFEADHEAAAGFTQLAGEIFMGADGAPTLREHDETLPPLALRPELIAAQREGAHSGCVPTPGRKRLICHAARRLEGAAGEVVLVLVQESSRRDIRALYDLRYQLLKLMLVVVPLGVLISFWLAWRLVRPVERLRAEVLGRARDAAPRADINIGRRDEVGDLAAAFNAMLAALRERASANEAFLADLAHEFKNPVAALRASAERLEQSETIDPDRARRLASVMQRSCARLDELVTSLLELARAEAGLPNEVRATVDLAALTRGVVDSVREAATEAKVELRLRVPDTALEIEAVSLRVESLLRNLIDNALSFAGNDGWVEISLTADTVHAVVEVSDSGPGITEEDLPRIFDRFFTSRHQGRGAGLGLAMCRAIVEAHGGQIEATSAPGQGASFTVHLPRSVAR